MNTRPGSDPSTELSFQAPPSTEPEHDEVNGRPPAATTSSPDRSSSSGPTTTTGNRITSWILQSPLHRLIDGRVCLVRYRGRRSARTITTPVQYARHSDQIVIVAGNAAAKHWWRNFTTPAPAELWLDGRWQSVELHVDAATDAQPAVARYVQRFHLKVADVARSVVLIGSRR